MSFDFIIQDKTMIQDSFQMLRQCAQHQWMLDIFGVNDIISCLEPFLSRSDNLRWLTLTILYPFLPQLSDKQKNSLLLTQMDTKRLIQNLRNPCSFDSAVKLMTHAVSLPFNIKRLFENGIVELLAEFLNDQNIRQEDQDNIVSLIENIVTADTSSVDLIEQHSTTTNKNPATNATCSVEFIQLLES